MTEHSHLADPDYWRNRAQQLRALARQFSDLHARTGTLRVAEDYDRLAKSAEERAARTDQPSARNFGE